MISYLSGTIEDVKEQCLTVNSGILGLMVYVARPTFFQRGDSVKLYIHLHWNQEQGPTLFGFKDELEKTVFLLITSCSGMGPKVALSVLAHLEAHEFLEAIQTANDRALSNVNGIGNKKAEQMILQLKHKVGLLIKSGVTISSNAQQWHEIMEVLTSLHYSRQEISRAMDYLKQVPEISNAPFDQRIRHALSFLAKKA